MSLLGPGTEGDSMQQDLAELVIKPCLLQQLCKWPRIEGVLSIKGNFSASTVHGLAKGNHTSDSGTTWAGTMCRRILSSSP